MLIKCPECGKELSDKASKCPNCGCPIEEIKSVYEDADPAYTEALVARMRQYVEILERKISLLNSMQNNKDGQYYLPKLDSYKIRSPLKLGAIIGGILALLGMISIISNSGFNGTTLTATIVCFFVYGGITAAIVNAVNKGTQKKIDKARQYIGDSEEFQKAENLLSNIDISDIPDQYRNIEALRGIANILDKNKTMVVMGAVREYEMQTEENERKANERKQIELLEKQNQILALSAQISALHAKSTALNNATTSLQYLNRKN